MLTSTVKWFNGERGFITADDGYRDIFYHSGQLFDQDHELSKRDLRAAVSPSGS
jgi:cold shock CspA family protein